MFRFYNAFIIIFMLLVINYYSSKVVISYKCLFIFIKIKIFIFCYIKFVKLTYHCQIVTKSMNVFGLTCMYKFVLGLNYCFF